MTHDDRSPGETPDPHESTAGQTRPQQPPQAQQPQAQQPQAQQPQAQQPQAQQPQAQQPQAQQPQAQQPPAWGPPPAGPGAQPWGSMPAAGEVGVTGPPPPSGPGRGPGRKRRSGAVPMMVAGAVVIALVGGAGGGLVGYQMRGGNEGSAPALGAPSGETSQVANLPDNSTQAVAERVLPTVVQIKAATARGTSSGSGIVISDDGMILTNNHVVEGAANGGKLRADFNNGESAPASIVGRDPTADLAVIKAKDVSGLQTAQLGDSSSATVGEQVIAVGSPLGYAGTVTSGIVSSTHRPVLAGGQGSGQETVIDAIQTDAPINPGNSGGPLVDLNGKVIGINSVIATVGQSARGGESGSIGLGFSIPINQARRIADELIKTGESTQPRLGVRVGQQSGTEGATVAEVTRGSAAAAAGLEQGDVITKVGDRAIADPESLIAAVRSHKPGSEVTLTVQRNGDQSTVTATLGSKTVDAG